LALSKIRRVLIATVGFLLLINLILLGVAWINSVRSASQANDVVAWTTSDEAAETAARLLRDAGRKVSISVAEREVQVPNGFRLVKSGELYVKSYYETLKTGGAPVRIVGNGAEVQYGDVWPDRAKAEAARARVLKSFLVKFDIVPSHRTEKVSSHRLVVSGLNDAATVEVVEFFKEKSMDPSVRAPLSKPSGEPG